jgi:hypothetical protein
MNAANTVNRHAIAGGTVAGIGGRWQGVFDPVP